MPERDPMDAIKDMVDPALQALSENRRKRNLDLSQPEPMPMCAACAEVFGWAGLILGAVLVIGMVGAVLWRGAFA